MLARIEQGDPHAADLLLPVVYEELRQLAAAKLARERPGQTLDATGLVHEAYLRLLPSCAKTPGQFPMWDGRGHFFAAAAEAMRRILVENARRKNRRKHGGDRQQVDLDPAEIVCSIPDENLLALDEAVTRLAEEDPQKANLVQLRYFAGLTIAEAASALGISEVTAKRHWRYARAWLHRELNAGEG